MKNKFILLISLLVSGGLSFFACKLPDGLEKVAEDQGFINSAVGFWRGIIPDYLVSGISSEWLATALAGLVGTLIVFEILKLIEIIIINQHKYESK